MCSAAPGEVTSTAEVGKAVADVAVKQIKEEVEQTIDNYECQVKIEDVIIDLSFIDTEIGSEEVQSDPAENEAKVEEMKPKLGRGMRKQFPTKL